MSMSDSTLRRVVQSLPPDGMVPRGPRSVSAWSRIVGAFAALKVTSFQAVVRQIAPSAGGVPIKLRFLDMAHDIRKEVLVN
jgi:hypothetical protein